MFATFEYQGTLGLVLGLISPPGHHELAMLMLVTCRIALNRPAGSAPWIAVVTASIALFVVNWSHALTTRARRTGSGSPGSGGTLKILSHRCSIPVKELALLGSILLANRWFAPQPSSAIARAKAMVSMPTAVVGGPVLSYALPR